MSHEQIQIDEKQQLKDALINFPIQTECEVSEEELRIARQKLIKYAGKEIDKFGAKGEVGDASIIEVEGHRRLCIRFKHYKKEGVTESQVPASIISPL